MSKTKTALSISPIQCPEPRLVLALVLFNVKKRDWSRYRSHSMSRTETGIGPVQYPEPRLVSVLVPINVLTFIIGVENVGAVQFIEPFNPRPGFAAADIKPFINILLLFILYDFTGYFHIGIELVQLVLVGGFPVVFILDIVLLTDVSETLVFYYRIKLSMGAFPH